MATTTPTTTTDPAATTTDPAARMTVEERNAALGLTAGNVRVGISGAVYVAPTGTVGPTDATTALAAAWKSLGYISEDGVEVNPSQTSTTSIKAWQNSAEVRKAVDGVENTIRFTMLEYTKADAVGLYIGKALSAGDKDYTYGGAGLQRVSLVLDVVDGDYEERIWVPEAEVTERGSVVYKNGEAIGLEVTLSCYPSSEVNNEAFKSFRGAALL